MVPWSHPWSNWELEAGHLTHHHLWHGTLDLWRAFSLLEKHPGGGKVEPILFAEFWLWRFYIAKRDVISSCEPNFGGSLDILSENRQVMQLLAGSRWGVCWKTRGWGNKGWLTIQVLKGYILNFVLGKCILLLEVLLAEHLNLILNESIQEPTKAHSEPP